MSNEPDTWQHQPAANEGGMVLVIYVLIGVAFVAGFAIGAAVVGLVWWLT